MITQTPISARIDATLLWQMEQETMVSGYKRNRILNQGARLWLDLMDKRRELRAHVDPDVRKKILKGFVLSWFPEASGLEIL